jgi:2-oxo-4-hydroxy-4-carboxy-5-ureidoimidazoline decarboxylase
VDVATLNAMDEAAFVREMEPLFEGAPRFLARLAAERPFAGEAELFAAARRVAAAMPPQDQLELVDAHPRIGALPGSVSASSFVEQGYDREAAGAAAEAERARVRSELDRLNAAYEQKFGFRFVIFVNGRSRAEIVPLMEDRLRGDRGAELSKALEDVVAIAQDRWRKRA